MNEIQIGETRRYYCGECSKEFEICLEPKVAENPRMAEGCPEPTAQIKQCPFCGNRGLEEV